MWRSVMIIAEHWANIGWVSAYWMTYNLLTWSTSRQQRHRENTSTLSIYHDIFERLISVFSATSINDAVTSSWLFVFRSLFLKSKMLKLFTLVHSRTAQITYQVLNNPLPGSVQKWLCYGDGSFEERVKMKIIFLETGNSFEKAFQPHGFH